MTGVVPLAQCWSSPSFPPSCFSPRTRLLLSCVATLPYHVVGVVAPQPTRLHMKYVKHNTKCTTDQTKGLLVGHSMQ